MLGKLRISAVPGSVVGPPWQDPENGYVESSVLEHRKVNIIWRFPNMGGTPVLPNHLLKRDFA